MTRSPDLHYSDRWHASDAYAEMVRALHATGYRDYPEALAERATRPERWLRFHRRWTTLMQTRCGIDPSGAANAGKATGLRPHVKRG